MATIVRYHKLKVVTADIDIDTLEPKKDILEKLISINTVAILIAHLYGCQIYMKPFILIAKKYKLHIIEDCSECFSGFKYLGHPESDVSFFSFGVIKFQTAFGGGIAKVKDTQIYSKMHEIYLNFPRQTNQEYLQKVLKYSVMYSVLHVKPFPQLVEKLRKTGFDNKELFISFLRGFPINLIMNIRKRPSPALLSVMVDTQSQFDRIQFDMQRIKGEYFCNGLPEEMWPVGMDVRNNTFWLFPVMVVNSFIYYIFQIMQYLQLNIFVHIYWFCLYFWGVLFLHVCFSYHIFFNVSF